MVYLIQIGHNSRRGAFNKLHEKVILVEDGSSFYEVENHFKAKYEGFEVIVKLLRAEPVKDIEHRVIEDVDEKTPQSCVGNFKIQYTEDEKRLHEEYVKSTQAATSALSALHQAIENRYKQLYYSNIEASYYNAINKVMELETDSYETRCLKFPVKADLFIEAAQKCDGTIPEKKPEPTPEFPKDDAVLDGSFPDDDPEPESETDKSAYSHDDIPF